MRTNEIGEKQRNVTLKPEKKKNEYNFPCPICKTLLIVKKSKKGKTYCVCNDCGIQLFVRGEKGINLLNKIKLINCKN